MNDFRGSWSRVGFSLMLGFAAIACGGSDDDAGGALVAGSGGTKSSGNGGTKSSGGTDANAGSPDDAAGSTASGGTGGTGGATGTGGDGGAKGGTTSAGGTANAGKGGSATRGGSGATGEAGASATSELLDEIGAACKEDCDQQFALDCAPQSSNTLTCQLSCASTTTQLGDFCLAEYRDFVQCRADGGYDCVSGNPYQRSTCAAQQVAFSECTQHLGCKRFCEKTAELGCNDTPFDTCVADCTSEGSTLSSTCAYQTEAIASCQATYAKACDGDALEVPASCTSSVLNVADCLNGGSTGYCPGWCWASDKLGCGPGDCASDCAARTTDASCGSTWTSLLDCVLFFGDGMCSADGLTISGNGVCDSEQSQYATCVMGEAGAASL